MQIAKMNFTGKVVTRVFKFSLHRIHLYRSQRICSVVVAKTCCNLGSQNKPTGISINSFSAFKRKVHSVAFNPAMGALSPMDPSSFSRPELAVVKHISLSLNVDFDNKVLCGVAILNVDVLDNITEVILDSSKLNIESVETDDGKSLKFNVGEEVPNYGSKLTVTLKEAAIFGENAGATETGIKNVRTKFLVFRDRALNKFYPKRWLRGECPVYVKPDKKIPDNKEDIKLAYKGFLYVPEIEIDEETRSYRERQKDYFNSQCQCFYVKQVTEANGMDLVNRVALKIKYSTSPEASALQWLDPNQTSGKTLPYMFSQCQPIHARSIIPCQDTPAVKFTYDAQVTAPTEYTVLMSALRGEVKGNTTSFRQPMPLPSYLVAIAVGQLESKHLGPRSRVWSEKESLEISAWEFAETEHYLAAAEKLCGKYEWTEYDLLVLPPSFPYGGMENPCLTFVTPTLLAGDRSLADVIVHEIMHSWTGNLVTNRNFEHFWLNEGFTVYLERKVTASLVKDPEEAKKVRDFSSILGLQELTETVNTIGPDSPLTLLVPNLQNVHPDDAFSRVPYEKGSLFLRYLEDLLGGPAVFDEFLRSYLSQFSTKSLDTNDFKAYLYKYFDNDARLNQVDWETWLYKPGMPPVIPNYDTSMTKSVDDLVERLGKDPTFKNTDVIGFTPQQMIYLLQKLVDGKPIPKLALADLYTNYQLGESKNAEIMYRWIRICIRSNEKSKMDEYFKFVNSQGRMKYVRPIYRDLYAWKYSRPLAIANFLQNEKYMMHVSAYTLRKDLHLNES